MTTLEELETLVSDYQYIEGDEIVLTVGIRATFYFWDGQSAAKRNALIDCIETYQNLYGDNLSLAFDADLHKFIPFAKMRPLRQLVRSMDEDDQIEYYVCSGDDEDAVAEYRISALTERGWQAGEMSVVSFTLPRDHAYVQEKKAKFIELIELFAEKLAPFHGHAGLSAVSTYEQYKYQPDEIDVATRYRGLFIEYPAIDVSHAHNGIKSVDWITFIGQSFSQRIGGLEALESTLSSQVLLKKTSTGVFITAGEQPDIAPIEEEMPQQLSLVNNLLRPLRNGAFGSMGFGTTNRELRFNRCTSDLWIRRLDNSNIWPPASFIGLPRTPVGKPSRKKIKLKTGDTCINHGRYRNPVSGPMTDDDDEAPQVVLLPGDIAPYWLKLGDHGEYLGRESVDWELVAELK